MEINRLTITTESRILGDEYVRFGGEYIETCFHKGKQGALCLAIGTNHIRIFRDGRKMFDYYPLRMKLFDYHNWYQLTYPSFGNGDGKWEQELQEIIGRLSAA